MIQNYDQSASRYYPSKDRGSAVGSFVIQGIHRYTSSGRCYTQSGVRDSELLATHEWRIAILIIVHINMYVLLLLLVCVCATRVD